MFDDLVAATTGTSGAGAVGSWARMENASCARRLAAMVTMLDDAYAASGSADRDWWYLDNWGAVSAHIGAAQCMTQSAASGQLMIATVLRDRLPLLAQVFWEGLISFAQVRIVVSRTTLVTDAEALHALDTALAAALREWEPMSRQRTEQAIDAFVAEVDPVAVRRREDKARSRYVDVTTEDGSGTAELVAVLFAHDATAFYARVTALADTVCPADPRTKDQRRADATGALAAGADRLACLCEQDDCPAALLPPSSGVVVYVVAHEDTLADPPTPDAPADPPPGDPTPARDDSPAANGSAKGQAALGPLPKDGPSPFVDAAAGGTAESEAASDAEQRARAFYAECTNLDGTPPPLYDKPLRELTFRELFSPRDDRRLSVIRPGAMMGGRFLPGAVTRRAALKAQLVRIVHPGHAPPEPRYRPSKKLADFVRCRDQTCRFPGCQVPATHCDVDHTIPWPYGPTHASNLKCLCRFHHLLKTHWGGPDGWRERQFPDGTVEWIAPDGQTYRTDPGSRLPFPELCRPTAPMDVNPADVPAAHTGGLTMPRRRTTRAKDRARRIDEERELNALLIATEEEGRGSTDRDSQRDSDLEGIPPPF